MSTTRYTNQPEPDDTPPSGRSLFYIDDVDKLPKIKLDDGTVISIAASSEPSFYFVTNPVVDAAVTTEVIDANVGTVVITTTIGNSQTLSMPTESVNSRSFIFVNSNTSSDSIVVDGVEVFPASFLEFIWDSGAWVSSDSVTGPQTSVDNQVTLFDGSTGKLVKTSSVTDADIINSRNHITVITNPHSVTSTQVGLSNVTNDSQLKRLGADFTTFDGKLAPVGGDKLLIEDSEDSSNKKVLDVGNLPKTNPGGINSQVQFNDGGVFNGDVNLTWDKASNTHKILGNIKQQGGEVGNLYTPELVSVIDLVDFFNPGAGIDELGDLVVVGDYIYYYFVGDSVVHVIDVSEPTVPRLVDAPGVTVGIEAIDVTEEFLYVAAFEALKISSISFGISAGDGGDLVLPGITLKGVKVYGSTVFVTTDVPSFMSIDISNIGNLRVIDELILSTTDVGHFHISNGVAYISGSQLVVVDVNKPGSMSEVDYSPLVISSVSDTHVSGNTLYVTHIGSSPGISVFDVSVLQDIRLRSEFNEFSFSRIIALGGFVYAISAPTLDPYELVVIDSSNFSSLTEIANRTVLGFNGSAGIDLVGDRIFITNGRNLFILDISSVKFQSSRVGSLRVGNVHVDGSVISKRKIKADSFIVGSGGIISRGPIVGGYIDSGNARVTRGLQLLPDNISLVYNSSGSLFDLGGGLKYVICSSPRLDGGGISTITIDDGESVEIVTTNLISNYLYQDTGVTYIFGNSVHSLRIECNIVGENVGTLFDITFDGSLDSSFVFNCSGAFNWDNLGTISNVQNVYFSNVKVRDFSAGLVLHNVVNVNFINCDWSNTSDSGADFVSFSETAPILKNVNFSYSRMAVQGTERAFNIPDSINSSALIHMNNIYDVPEGLFFNASGKDQTDPGVITRDCSMLPDSTINAEVFLSGNTEITLIPVAGASVKIAANVNWISSELERIEVTNEGVLTVTALTPTRIAFDLSAALLVTSGNNRVLEVETYLVESEQRSVTFLDVTNIVKEEATPRVDGDRIYFGKTPGTLPTGTDVRDDIFYYVINEDTDNFQLSLLQGGSAVTFSDNGTPVNSYQVCNVIGDVTSVLAGTITPQTIHLHVTLRIVLGIEVVVAIRNDTSTNGVIASIVHIRASS